MRVSLVLDCRDLERVAAFWTAVLDAEAIEDDPYLLLVSRHRGVPALLLQPVPEEKVAKNRMHLDLHVDPADADTEVERIVALGARRVEERTGNDFCWQVMADPEGNEFCVCWPA